MFLEFSVDFSSLGGLMGWVVEWFRVLEVRVCLGIFFKLIFGENISFFKRFFRVLGYFILF